MSVDLKHPPACRFCGAPLTQDFVDLGLMPLSNSYPSAGQIAAGPDKSYPLTARVCTECFLVQVDAPVAPENIFSDYAYFSSYSDSWVEHARRYAMAMIERFDLGKQSLVVEVASNDGYLLQHFLAQGVNVLGIEPAANVAEIARRKGITTEVAFFGKDTARASAANGVAADLMTANNVLAHVPAIGDFIAGFAEILKPTGVSTFEFPHLLKLIRELEFDTIYHEHFSYLSLLAVERILTAAKLRAFDVEEIPTHGGSLRLFVCHANAPRTATQRLAAVRMKEKEAGLDRIESYAGFADKVQEIKTLFLAFIAQARAEGKTVAAYGAAAKGNTFLNVCGITAKDIVCVYDRSAVKQGRYLPGSHIPIRAPETIGETKPNYLLILPWNLRGEITTQMAGIGAWGGRFVTAIPKIEVFSP